MVRKEVKDKAVLQLIRRFLKSGVPENGLVSPTSKGTPQGGNLSPLLSSIYLTAFDRMLESRGHRFVRYADDCGIYVPWIRRRIRQILWKRWKRIKTRHDNLKRLGVEDPEAWKWANSPLGSWRVAGSKILATTLTNARLEALDYDDIAKRYQTLHVSY